MKIAIIGAGNIGGNLTRRLSAAGHDVTVANSRGPETLAELAAETGATPALTRDAARGAEVVVITIPLIAVADLPADLLDDAADGVVVIDTNNYYYQRDGRIAEIEDGLTESEWVSRRIGRPVIKAFNGIFAHNLIDAARAKGDPERIALPVAGDDPQAKAVVMGLIDDIGFDAVDAGPLADSWRMQPGTPSYGPELKIEALRGALAAATPERPAEHRAA